MTESLEAAISAVLSGMLWASFKLPLDVSAHEFESVLSRHGQLQPSRRGAPAVDVLRPLVADQARPNTLSARHGVGRFPLHVDGAQFKVPPRLIVLWYARNEEERATPLLEWRLVETALADTASLRREVFLYRGVLRGDLDSITSTNRAYVRYDPGCMNPETRSAADLLHRIQAAVDALPTESPDCAAGDGIVIDNWRVLHGRGEAKQSGERLILRGLLVPRNVE